MSDHLTLLSQPLGTIAQSIRSKKLSPVELVDVALSAIKSLDGFLHCFTFVDEEGSRRRAIQLEQELMQGRPRGPLHGIPFGIKDIFFTRGMPTTGCSRALRSYNPDLEATAVQRLLRAGAIPLGKLTTFEFATGGPSFDLPWPPAVNPWDVLRNTGGSSSGSAAAVAASLCSFALGTDTGGSVRTPAAFCGVAGYRPTAGRVSRFGVLPLAPSFDTVGVIGQTVSDCADVVRAMEGEDGADPGTRTLAGLGTQSRSDLSGITIGVPECFFKGASTTDVSVLAAYDGALQVCEGLGATLQKIKLSPLSLYTAAFRIGMLGEAYAIHGPTLETTPELYGKEFQYRVGPGSKISAAQHVNARVLARRLANEIDQYFGEVHVIAVPTAFGTAPKFSDIQLKSNFEAPQLTAPFSVSGSPTAAIPIGLSAGNLPIGLQLAGKAGRDDLVLEVATLIERAIGFAARRAMELRTRLMIGQRSPTLTPAPISNDKMSKLDPALRREAEALVTRISNHVTPEIALIDGEYRPLDALSSALAPWAVYDEGSRLRP